MSRSTFGVVVVAVLVFSTVAPAQIRIATYNTETAFTTNGNTNPGLQTVLQGTGDENFNGISKRVDILTLTEQNNTTGTTTSQILTMMNNLYGAGTYAKGNLVAGATSNPNTDSSAVIYDTTKFQLIAELGVGTPSTSGMPRQEIRYQFRPVGYQSNSDFYIYVGHWKAGGTQTDQDRRQVEAQVVRNHANTLPANSRTLYAGDFNITQGATETAWTTMTAAGGTQGIDPRNNSWANINRTWSTTGLGSRLDFIMNTPPTNDGRGFSYIANSYRTFGNNGTTPQGGAATHGANTALPGLPNRSAVLSALTTASDHYPVVSDYRYPARMGVSVGSVPGQVIVGAAVPVSVIVTNTAPVTIAAGADGLDYSVTGSGAVSGTGAAIGLLALVPGNVHELNLDTANPGPSSGTVNATSTSQEVADGSFQQNVSTTVLAHSNASFNGGSDVDVLPIDFGIRARGSGVITNNFSIFNLDHSSGFTAGLDVDSVAPSGDIGRLTSNVSTFNNLAAGGSQSFSAGLNTQDTGLFNTTYELSVSDQNLPGATSGNLLLLALSGRVAIGGDANLDNAVNLNDFNTLAANFGTSGATWQTGDFTNDMLVNLSDFNVLAGNFGLSAGADGVVDPQDWATLASVVPEPTWTASLIACLVLAGRRSMRDRR